MTQATKKKHVTREVIYNYELPDDNMTIVQVIRGCGNNLHEVNTATGEQFLVSMPTKFRRSIWIKRGDYLMVTPIEEGNKVRAEIHSILLKDQIRYIKEMGKWPKEFDSDCNEHDESKVNKKVDKLSKNITENKSDDNSDSQSEVDDYDDLLIPNTNRVYFEEEEENDDESSEESDSEYC